MIDHARRALSYAEIDWCVVPIWWVAAGHCACSRGAQCKSPGKHPIPKNGLKAASTNREQIRTWWRTHPDAHIGIHTGRSGLVVFDIDERNGGFHTWRRLVELHPDLPSCIRQITGGGGEHHFYASEAGVTWPNKLGDGVDVRQGESYCVVDPSGHITGGSYRFPDGCDPWTVGFMLAPPPRRLRPEGKATQIPRKPDWTDEAVAFLEETPEQVAKVRSALSAISADCSYAEWIKILFGVKSTGWACAEELAREWSLTSPHRYEEDEFDRVWRRAR